MRCDPCLTGKRRFRDARSCTFIRHAKEGPKHCVIERVEAAQLFENREATLQGYRRGRPTATTENMADEMKLFNSGGDTITIK
jgi:hypothetical protein